MAKTQMPAKNRIEKILIIIFNNQSKRIAGALANRPSLFAGAVFVLTIFLYRPQRSFSIFCDVIRQMLETFFIINTLGRWQSSVIIT